MRTEARRQYMKEYLTGYRQRPENKEKQMQYHKKYCQRPEFKEQRRQYKKMYRQRPGNKEKERLYQQRPRIKEYKRQYGKKYRQRPRVKAYWQRPEMKEYMRQYNKKYRQRPESKEQERLYRQRPEVKMRIAAKWARYKAKGFTPLCSNDWICPVDWHHASPPHPYVVPIPRTIHRAVGGKHHYVFNAFMIYLLYGLELGAMSVV